MSKSVHYITIDRDGTIKRHSVKPKLNRHLQIWTSKGCHMLGDWGYSAPFRHFAEMKIEVHADLHNTHAVEQMDIVRKAHIQHQPSLAEMREMGIE